MNNITKPVVISLNFHRFITIVLAYQHGSYVFLRMSVKVTNERIDHAILAPGKSGTELFVKMHPNIDVVKMKEQTQYFNVTFDLLVYTGSHGSWNNLHGSPSGMIMMLQSCIFVNKYSTFFRFNSGI